MKKRDIVCYSPEMNIEDINNCCSGCTLLAEMQEREKKLVTALSAYAIAKGAGPSNEFLNEYGELARTTLKDLGIE